jgi:carboxymethylenebutenolidase
MACAAACSAQDWAKAALAKSPRHGEYVTIAEPGGRKLQAYVVYPEIATKAPVVVLIHEIFGESDWFKEMADEIAGAGYIAIAPDLLSGWGPNAAAAKPMAGMGADDHMHMDAGAPGAAYAAALPGGTTAFPDQQSVVRAVVALPDSEVLADLDAAADYGKKLPSSIGKTYVAGFCWGGGKSFLYATHRKDLSGAFVFYGPPPPADAMKSIVAPVYGFYAANDARITATVPQATADMKAAGKVYEPVIYDGAGHGFMRAGEAPDANAANTAARAEGFRRMVTLLGGVH